MSLSGHPLIINKMNSRFALIHKKAQQQKLLKNVWLKKSDYVKVVEKKGLLVNVLFKSIVKRFYIPEIDLSCPF